MNSIIDVMEILLENGADANVADKNGSTSLMGASINGHLQTIKFLIKQGTRNSWVQGERFFFLWLGLIS